MHRQLLSFLLLFFCFFCSGSPVYASLELLFPRGGEVLHPGSTATISWIGIDERDKVKLEYSTDDGKTWKLIRDSVTGHSYSWLVPYDISPTCLARITQTDVTHTNEITPTILAGLDAGTGALALQSVAINSSGTNVAVMGGDGALFFWNPVDGKTRYVPHDSVGAVSLMCNGDGTELIGCSELNGALYRMGLDGKIKAQGSFMLEANMACLNTAKNLLVGCSRRGELCVVDATTFNTVYKTAFAGINSVAFSPDGELLYVVFQNTNGYTSVRAIETAGWTAKWQLNNFLINTLCISPDGKQMARLVRDGLVDRKVYVEDIETGAFIASFIPHESTITRLEYSPDGTIITAGLDSTIAISNATTGKTIHVLRGHRGEVNCLSLDASGKYIVSGDRTGLVMLWDAATGALLQEIRSHTARIVDVQLNRSRTRALTSDWDGTAILWDVERTKPLAHLNQWSNEWSVSEMRTAVFSPDDTEVAIQEGDTLVFRNASTMAVVRKLPVRSGRLCGYSLDGRFLATTGEQFILWDRATWKQVFSTTAFQDTKGIFMPDGKQLLIPRNDKTLVYDLVNTRITDTLRYQLPNHFSDGRQLRQSDSGLVTVNSPGISEFISLTKFPFDQLVGQLSSTDGPVYAVQFTPDGQFVISVGNKTVIWDWAKRLAVRKFPAGGRCLSVVDDSTFITGNGGSAFVWHTQSPQLQQVVSASPWSIEHIKITAELQLLVPNGTEQWAAESQQEIRWKAADTTGSVRLEYSVDAGYNWHSIERNATGSSYIWDVPNKVSRRCMVRVSKLLDSASTSADWSWAQQIGDSRGIVYPNSTAVDNEDNILVTGRFQGVLATADGHEIQGAGQDYRAYFMKCDRTGKTLWLRGISSECYSQGVDIKTGPNNEVVVVAILCGNADFGNGIHIESPAGSYYTVVVKYTRDGAVQWVCRLGDSKGSPYCKAAIDPSGFVTVAGGFSTALRIEDSVYASSFDQSVFVARFTSSGDLQWVRTAGSRKEMEFGAVAVGNKGQIYIGGYYNGTANFGQVGQGDSLTSPYTQNAFYAKYNPSGELLWAKAIVQNEPMAFTRGYRVTGLAVDATDHAYMAGYFMSTALFPGGITRTSAGGIDAFVAKCSPSGEALWVQQMQGIEHDRTTGLDIDSKGNSYAVVQLLDTLTLGSSTLKSVGKIDIAVVKYDSSGSMVWARRAGGAQDDKAVGISVDSRGAAFIAGLIGGAADFGHIPMNTVPPYREMAFLAAIDAGQNIVFDESDELWTIHRPDLKLMLTSPNGGERLMTGTEMQITWQGALRSDTVALEYSIDAGRTWRFITQQASGLQYTWKVPDSLSSTCLMRVTDHENILTLPYKTLAVDSNVHRAQWLPNSDILLIHSTPWLSKISTFSFWDIHTDSLFTIKEDEGDVDLVSDIISPDGSLLGILRYNSQSKMNRISVYDISTKSLLWSQDVRQSMMRWSHTGEYLYLRGATEIPDSSVVFRARTGEIQGRFPFTMTSFARFSPTDNDLAVCDWYTIKIWDVESMQLIHNWEVPTGYERLDNLLWLPDGKQIMLAYTKNTRDSMVCVIWDVETESVVSRISTRASYSDFSWNSTGTQCAISQRQTPPLVWSREDNSIGTLRSSVASVDEFRKTPVASSVQWNYQKNLLATGDSLGRIWDMTSQQVRQRCTDNLFGPVASEVAEMLLNTEGSYAAMRCWQDPVIRVFPVADAPLRRDSSDAMWSIVKSVVSPAITAIDFGEVVVGEYRDSVVQALLQNTSTSAVALQAAAINGVNASEFSILAGQITQPVVLQPGDVYGFTLRFAPSDTGVRTAGLQVDFNAEGSPLQIQLYGTGTRLDIPPDTMAVILEVVSTTAMVGQEVEIPILLHNAAEVVATGVTVLHLEVDIDNATILYPRDTEHIDSFSFNGETCHLVLKPLAVTANEELVRLRMVATLGNDTATTVHITACSGEGGVFTVSDTIPGRFILGGVCREGGVVRLYRAGVKTGISLSPNPATNIATVKASIGEKGYVRLLLQDVLGTTLQKIYEGEVMGGELQRDVYTDGLPAGVYYIHLQTPTMHKTEVLNITR